MKLSIFTNHKSTSLMFSTVLLAMLLVEAGSPSTSSAQILDHCTQNPRTGECAAGVTGHKCYNGPKIGICRSLSDGECDCQPQPGIDIDSARIAADPRNFGNRPPSIATGDALAFASVARTGAKQSGTSNITSDYNSTTGLYELKIAGVCFVRTSYTTVATVSGYNGFPDGALFVNTDDDGHFCHLTGKLNVGLRDVNGNLQKADFQVVVFHAQ